MVDRVEKMAKALLIVSLLPTPSNPILPELEHKKNIDIGTR